MVHYSLNTILATAIPPLNLTTYAVDTGRLPNGET
jgi:hypothetical protein